jgi:hypothetical protein
LVYKSPLFLFYKSKMSTMRAVIFLLALVGLQGVVMAQELSCPAPLILDKDNVRCTAPAFLTPVVELDPANGVQFNLIVSNDQAVTILMTVTAVTAISSSGGTRQMATTFVVAKSNGVVYPESSSASSQFILRPGETLTVTYRSLASCKDQAGEIVCSPSLSDSALLRLSVLFSSPVGIFIPPKLMISYTH